MRLYSLEDLKVFDICYSYHMVNHLFWSSFYENPKGRPSVWNPVRYKVLSIRVRNVPIQDWCLGLGVLLDFGIGPNDNIIFLGPETYRPKMDSSRVCTTIQHTFDFKWAPVTRWNL